MTPKQLNYFARIAECGSFAAASRELLIAQPALSHQIANLESELGVKLLFRKPRGIELTESGERLLEHAYSILRHIESSVLDVQSVDLEPQGMIRVGMVPAINNVLASQLAKAVEARYPKIDLEIVGAASIHLNQQLDNRKIDISIVHPDSVGFDKFSITPLLKESLFFVGSANNSYPHIKTKNKDNVIRFADIAHYLTLSNKVHDGLGFRIHQYEEQTGIKLNKKRSYGQLLTDLNVVLAGEAEMILPWSAIYHLADDPRLVTAKIIEPEMDREIFMLTSPGQSLTNALMKTQKIIQSLIGGIFSEGRSVGVDLTGSNEEK